MATEVELEIFSCARNPQWTLSSHQAGEYRHLYDQALRRAAGTLGGAPLDWSLFLPTVGYTGFKVTVDDGPAEHVYRNLLFRSVGIPIPFGAVEEFLFRTYEAELREKFGLDISVLRPQPPTRIREMPEISCPTTALHCGSASFPDSGSKWNCQPYKGEDACYNYANNILTQNRLFPGDVEFVRDADHMRFLLKEVDGLTPHDRLPAACSRDPTAHYIVGLLHNVGFGTFHFLRLDHNGFWSHKNGAKAATKRDAHGLIGDLCRAEFTTPYTFAGFFESNADVRTELERRGEPATTCDP